MRRLVILLPFLLAALLSCGQRPGPSPTPQTPPPPGQGLEALTKELLRSPTQGQAGAVEAEALYQTTEYFQALAQKEGTSFERYQRDYLDKYLVFSLSLNTHSVDLSPYQLEALSLLRDGRGRDAQPVRWEEDQGSSSHHRSGRLLFPREGLDPASGLELVVRDVGGVTERTFRWDGPSLGELPLDEHEQHHA